MFHLLATNGQNLFEMRHETRLVFDSYTGGFTRRNHAVYNFEVIRKPGERSEDSRISFRASQSQTGRQMQSELMAAVWCALPA